MATAKVAEYFELLYSSAEKLWSSEERAWLVSFRSPLEVWTENPTYLMLEIVTYVWTILLYKHARKHGGRLYLLFFTAILHGLVVESLSYVLPDVDNFWHGVSSIIFFKQRLPLHIVLFYPCFHYTTNVAVYRLKLPWWSEPFAVGLADLLLDIPFDILGIKYLWWTWHDTDPNIFDRTYSVPLTSYLFHLSFASSFSLILHSTRWLMTGSRDPLRVAGGYFTEFVCMMLTATLSMPLAAIVQFLPLYHLFHDVFAVHTEICVLVLVGLYFILAWNGDRHAGMEARQNQTAGRKNKWFSLFDEISLSVLIHYAFYIVLVFVADPASYRSTGPHETIGDCNKTSNVNTVAGILLHKKTFLCQTNYSEPYFDFHCLSASQLPPNGSSHYTICGNPYSNVVEYRLIIVAICAFGLFVFRQILFKSGRMGKMKRA